MKELSAILHRLAAMRTPSALATLVQVEGSSYRRPGARLLVTADGAHTGSISGGCLEEDVAAHARTVLTSGAAAFVTYDTTRENDLVWGTGLGCHGIVRVLIERLPPAPGWAGMLAENLRRRRPTELAVAWSDARPELSGTYFASELPVPLETSTLIFRETIQPPTPLLTCGAGNDIRPLVRLAKELGWHVTVTDPRPAFATIERFPEADAVIVASPDDLAAHVPLDHHTLAVVMTHHYRHDLPYVRTLLSQPLAYLGLLGPKKRAEKILADLAVADTQRARLHAPVGLDLGGDTPETVALAILAEMQAVLTGRDGRPLRERIRPIHE
ncbi:MAG TPA: XdhC/CoxI family protein [Opitutaceae bacterium]|jgi:xanthine dehydrogenase accessory factor|nr:XdhC/CoxI family protein [Opitutaceae bacterium]